MISGFLLLGLCLLSGVLGTGTQTHLALPGQGLLALVALVSLLFHRNGSLAWKVALPVALTLGYLALRAWWSPVAYVARPDLYLALGGLMAFLFAALQGDQDRFRSSLVGALILLVLLNLGVGLYHLKDPSFSLLPGYSRDFPGNRIGGLYTNPNHLCSLVSLVLPLLIGACVVYRKRPARFFGCAAVVLGGVVMALLTFSRAGLIGLSASLVLLIAFLTAGHICSLKSKILWWVTGAALVVAMVGVVVGIQVANKRGDELFDTLGQRQQMASMAFRQVQENVVWGTGARSFRYLSDVYRPSNWKAHVQDRAPEFAHNDWVELVAEYGLVGLLFVLGALGVFYTVVWQWLRDQSTGSGAARRDVVFVAGAAAGIGGVLVHSFFDFNLHLWIHVLLVCLFLGAAIALMSRAGGGTQGRGFSSLLVRWWAPALLALLCAIMLGQWNVWRSEQFWSEGMRAAAKGEYTVSNSWFTQSLERMPDNGDALTSRASNYLAMAYRFRRRPEVKRSYETKALSDFERLTEINPRAYQGWLSRGLVLAELQRFEAAEQSFEHALKLAPNHRSAHFGYASYLFARAVVAEERSFAQQAQEHLDDVFPRFGSTPQSLTLYQQINDYLKRPDPPNTGAGQ